MLTVRRIRNDALLSGLRLSTSGGCTVMVKGRIGKMRRRIIGTYSNYIRVPRCNAGRSLGMSIAAKVVL